MPRFLVLPALVLTLAGLLAGPALALPGDVAPEGAPNGLVDIGDVLLVLNMTVGKSALDLQADIWPAADFGSSRLIEGDGEIDVQDVLLLLRVVVGLERLVGGVEVDTGTALNDVIAARFSFDGFWAAMGGALGIDELPPLNTPTTEDCADSGTVTILLTLGSQSIEADACDTGDFVIDGTSARTGSILDAILDLDTDLTMAHASGMLTAVGLIERSSGSIEFEPGRMGGTIEAMLDVTTTFPGARTLTFEADLIHPDDSDWPIGTVWVGIENGAAIEMTFDGSSTATATATDASGTRNYTINLVTGVVTAL